jgi:alkylhydroperoxidase family enzyme
MPKLRTLELAETAEELQPLFQTYIKERGAVPNMFRTMARAPQLLKTMLQHYRAVMFEGKLPVLLKELVICRVSQLNSCEY